MPEKFRKSKDDFKRLIKRNLQIFLKIRYKWFSSFIFSIKYA